MKPPNEYGEWTRGNAGQVGRTVVVHTETPFGWMPMVVWEPHPDELNDHELNCDCGSCACQRETQERFAE